jgi:hypothetical protein
VAAFASDALPPGVVAPFASEPLPVEPVFAFIPFVGPLPASFVDVAPLVGPLPASAFGCANAGNERPPATTAATKTVLNEGMKNSMKRRSATQLGWVAQVPPIELPRTRRTLIGTKGFRGSLASVLEDYPMPKPEDDRRQPAPVTPPTLPPDFPDIPQNPGSELQPPPPPFASSDKVAGTTPAPAESELPKASQASTIPIMTSRRDTAI